MRPDNLLTTGPLRVGLLRLAGPMFLASILQNIQSMIDLFWVGRLGSPAVAGVASAGAILFLLWPIAMGLSTGTLALVSRYFGAERRAEAAVAAGQSLTLAVVVGVVLGTAGLLFLPNLVGLIGAETEVRRLASAYLQPSLAGYATVLLLALGSAVFQGIGQAIRPMVAMGLANGLNMLLDRLFIFGGFGLPALGVQGAAWATVLAQTAACLVLISGLTRHTSPIRIRRPDMRPRPAVIGTMLRIGLFSTAQMLARSLMVLVLFRIVARCGTPSLAAYGIGMRFHHLVLLPSFVLGNAAAAMVGQNLGSRQPARAVRAAWLAATLGVAINAVAAVVLVAGAPLWIRLFDPNPEVARIGSAYLRIVSFFYLFSALGIILGRSMNGAGDTLPTMLITLLTLWGVQVPLAWGLARLMTPPSEGVWWSIAVANALNGLLITAWFQIGRWKRIRLG
jgi:putative MATE family efflux protein